MSHILDPTIFSSTCMHTHMSLQGVCVSSRGFLFGVCLGVFCLEGFVRGGFCPSPFLSEYIHFNRKLNITFNFRFHMYGIFLKFDVTCSWTTPPPVTNCHTFSDPSPSSVTYFMDGPFLSFLHNLFVHSSLQSLFPSQSILSLFFFATLVFFTIHFFTLLLRSLSFLHNPFFYSLLPRILFFLHNPLFRVSSLRSSFSSPSSFLFFLLAFLIFFTIYFFTLLCSLSFLHNLFFHSSSSQS